ncbi:LOW QUALITY PROTEIN: hypothetical protein U9M48_023431 [Paspalum notatum var. saurae]|uniref:SWIM-type domain-containing protein n=1 Tax=Paspalum notatum var. saurae TaxID=547442 RepID=A0AAQ3TKN5_PASNO
MAFRDSRQFKKALVKYGFKTKRHILFAMDEKKRVRDTCSWEACKSEWFKVVTFIDEHCCLPRRDNKLIKDNPTWKVELIKKAMLKDMLVDVSIAKCKRAKSIVLNAALDAMRGKYKRVYGYREELLRSNTGSIVVVCLNPDFVDRVFERLYVCFDACKKGFLASCRRLIGLDGCWFKGANNGQLLCAIARDANNQMYHASVATKTYDSRYWFIGRLQKDLNINVGGEGWNVCKSHLCQLEEEIHRKDLQNLWWGCAKALCRIFFNLRRARLGQETPDGARDTMNTCPQHWSRAFFKVGSNCDSVDNNLCESFNNSIMEARFYPVISMNEVIRKNVIRRKVIDKWLGTICPNIFKKLKVLQLLCVTRKDLKCKKNKIKVNLDQRICTCRYWQLSRLPCCHAISCIYKVSKALDDFVAPCFSIMNTRRPMDMYCNQS